MAGKIFFAGLIVVVVSVALVATRYVLSLDFGPDLALVKYGIIGFTWLILLSILGGAFQGARDTDWDLPGPYSGKDMREKLLAEIRRDNPSAAPFKTLKPKPQSQQPSGKEGPQPDEPSDATRQATYRVLFGEPTNAQPRKPSEGSEQSTAQKPAEPKQPAETQQSGDDISYRGEMPKRVRKEEKT